MRVMTYNIRGGLGMDGERSTERIADVITAQAPDILCLQEVHQRLPQSRFVDQPSRFEHLLGLPVVFQANLRLGPGGYGLALISRYPVQTVQNHLLPSSREQRGVLQVVLRTPGGPLTVFNTHWGLSGPERERQGSRLAALIAEAGTPVIVCGDFNERIDAAGLRELLAQTGLKDSDAPLDRNTYPVNAPEARIDFVLHSPDLAARAVFVVETQASDHFPVAVDFG